jgi:DNA-binding IclR family transcriptional regulator
VWGPVPEISKTADRALEVLVAVAEQGPVSTSELSRRLELNRTVAQRLVATLHRRGFVLRTRAGYVPGAALLQAAGQFFLRVRKAALPVMRQLSEAAGETVVLHAMDGDAAVVVAQVTRPEELVRVERGLGTRDPLIAHAGGRALLAFQPPATVQRALAAAGADELRGELQEVARCGYATSRVGDHAEVESIAAPIRGDDDVALASIAILIPASRDGALASHRGPLLEAARGIDSALAAVATTD